MTARLRYHESSGRAFLDDEEAAVSLNESPNCQIGRQHILFL